MRQLAKPTITMAFICFFGFGSCKKQDITPKEPDQPPQVTNTAPAIKMIQKPVTTPVGNAVRGYYIGLPSNYNQTTKRYPLLLFIPGAGQFGNGMNDLPMLLNDGIAQLLDEGRFPAVLKFENQEFSYIVMTPQFTWWPSTASIDACVEYAKQTYRIDESRLYLSGLSMGGILACDLASEMSSKFSAIVPMSGISRDYDVREKARLIASGNVPVWAFHSVDDQVFDIARVRTFISDINSFNPTKKSKLTEWSGGGHDAWTRALDPSYKEGGMNIYEWLLQYHR